jgi:hypothetical protein
MNVKQFARNLYILITTFLLPLQGGMKMKNEKNNLTDRFVRMETALSIVRSDPSLLPLITAKNPMLSDEKRKVKLAILKGICQKDFVVKTVLEFYAEREKA